MSNSYRRFPRLDVTLVLDRLTCRVRGHVPPPPKLITVDTMVNGYVEKCIRCGSRIRWVPPISRMQAAIKDLASANRGYFVDQVFAPGGPVTRGALLYEDTYRHPSTPEPDEL